MKTFNVNSYVWIKLTKLGLRKLKERHNEIYKQCPSVGKFTPPETDADGFCKMQLWEVMNIFGQCCSNGANIPFETNIRINDSEFEESEE